MKRRGVIYQVAMAARLAHVLPRPPPCLGNRKAGSLRVEGGGGGVLSM